MLVKERGPGHKGRLSRQAQSSAQLMDLFQVKWTQGQCTMEIQGS